MTKIELVVPDKLTKIDPALRDSLLAGAIRDVAAIQLKEKEEEVKDAKRNLQRFEEIYNKSFEDFIKEFPEDANFKLHEDFVEWSFWNDVSKKSEHLINDLEYVLGKR